MRRIFHNKVLYDEFPITTWPCCRWSLLLNDCGRLLGHFEVLHDTLDGVEVKFDLSEYPSDDDISADLRGERMKVVPDKLSRSIGENPCLDDHQGSPSG